MYQKESSISLEKCCRELISFEKQVVAPNLTSMKKIHEPFRKIPNNLYVFFLEMYAKKCFKRRVNTIENFIVVFVMIITCSSVHII